MADVKLADCQVFGPFTDTGKHVSRPMSEADLDSLIRERGVTDEQVEAAAKALYVWERTDPATGAFLGRPWDDARDNAEYFQAARAALEAALMTEEEE